MIIIMIITINHNNMKNNNTTKKRLQWQEQWKKLIITMITTPQSNIYSLYTLYIKIQEKIMNNKTPNSLPAWCRCGRSLCDAGHRGQGLHLLQGKTARENEAQTSTKTRPQVLKHVENDGRKVMGWIYEQPFSKWVKTSSRLMGRL